MPRIIIFCFAALGLVKILIEYDKNIIEKSQEENIYLGSESQFITSARCYHNINHIIPFIIYHILSTEVTIAIYQSYHDLKQHSHEMKFSLFSIQYSLIVLSSNQEASLLLELKCFCSSSRDVLFLDCLTHWNWHSLAISQKDQKSDRDLCYEKKYINNAKRKINCFFNYLITNIRYSCGMQLE